MERHVEAIAVGGRPFRVVIVQLSNSEYTLLVFHDNGTREGELVVEEKLRPDPVRGLLLDDADRVAADLVSFAGAGDPAAARGSVENALVGAALRFHLLQDTSFFHAAQAMRAHGMDVGELARELVGCARASGGDVAVAAGVLRAAGVAPEDVMGAPEGEGGAKDGEHGEGVNEGGIPPHDPCRALYEAMGRAAGAAAAVVVMDQLAQVGAIGRGDGLPPMAVGREGMLVLVDPFGGTVGLYRERQTRDGRIFYEPVGLADVMRARMLRIRRYLDMAGDLSYAVEVVKPDGEPRTYEGKVPQIVREMAEDAIVTMQRYAPDVLSTIISEAESRGLVAKERRMAPGIYVEGDELRAVWPGGAPPEGDLGEALDVLDELARWYREDKFATIVKWSIAAPLGFAVRRLGGVYPHLVLIGARGSAKTALAEIGAGHLWGKNPKAVGHGERDYERGLVANAGAGESLATPARVEYWGRTTTFPVFVNEAQTVFLAGRGNIPNVGVIEMLKNSATSVGGRGKFVQGQYRMSESLAQFIFTLNPANFGRIEFNWNELQGRTFIIINFPESEHKTEEEAAAFNSTVGKLLPKLSGLGRFAVEHALRRGAGWLREIAITRQEDAWDAIGQEVLEAAYRATGREPPGWIRARAVPRYDALYEEMLNDIRTGIAQRLNAALWRAYSEALRMPGAAPADDWAERIRVIARAGSAPWLRLMRSEEGGESREEAVLLNDVLDAMRDKDGVAPVGSLSEMADIMGWKYGVVFSRTQRINAKAVRVQLKELAALVSSEIKGDAE